MRFQCHHCHWYLEGMTETSTEALPAALIELLGRARQVLALTGAGVSAASGVPTFREAQTGLWARYDPTALATPEAFSRDPGLVWSWYAWRRSLLAGVEPNAAHTALACWPGPARLTVVTQNVDGLHQRAGSGDVIELHGRIDRDRCSAGCAVRRPGATGETPPACPECGAPMRPDVVWFGEPLPVAALYRAGVLAESADCVLSIGTSSLVRPAADLPWAALQVGVPVVEINTEATPLTRQADWSLRGGADEVLPRLVAALGGGPGG